jgi:hypothetical protein
MAREEGLQIRIDGLAVDSHAGRVLGNAVGRAALIEIARLDLAPGTDLRLRVPKDWVGRVIQGLDPIQLEGLGGRGPIDG